MFADDGNGVSATPLYLTDGKYDAPYGTYQSTEAHYGFLSATYTTPPIQQLHGLTLSFTEQGAAERIDHHVGDNLICTAGNMANINDFVYSRDNGPKLVCPAIGQEAYIDENPTKSHYYTSTETVTANYPLDRHKNGSNLIITETTGALNWYQNYPIPFRWASQTSATVSKRFNSIFSLAIRYRQQVEDVNGSYSGALIPMAVMLLVALILPFVTKKPAPRALSTTATGVSVIGTPYGYPSAQRVGSVDVIGTFHIDTKTLFH